MEDPKTKNDKKDMRHGDVKMRSSMYSNVKCPHCERMFAEAASLRHIPICKGVMAKPKKLEDKTHGNIKIFNTIGH
jgi:phage FluMu protein Com